MFFAGRAIYRKVKANKAAKAAQEAQAHGGMSAGTPNQSSANPALQTHEAMYVGGTICGPFHSKAPADIAATTQGAHQLRAQGRDQEAAQMVFAKNNAGTPEGTVDLHGLFVEEAMEKAEAAIAFSQQSGKAELRIIVGRGGEYDQTQSAMIKQGISQLMTKYRLSARPDPNHPGAIIIHLSGAGPGNTTDANLLARDLESQVGGGCVVM